MTGTIGLLLIDTGSSSVGRIPLLPPRMTNSTLASLGELTVTGPSMQFSFVVLMIRVCSGAIQIRQYLDVLGM